jgi:hypothetical protein
MSRLVLSNIDNRSRWQEKEKKTFGTWKKNKIYIRQYGDFISIQKYI